MNSNNNYIVQDYYYSNGMPFDNNNTNNNEFCFQQNDNVRMSNVNPTTPTSQPTFEFYLPLPNDTRIYHVTYTELDSSEIARLLNNNINLSHIPDHQFPHHHKVQYLIQQRIQPPIYHHHHHHQPQQSFDVTRKIQPISKVYLNNNVYNLASNEPIPNDMQNTANTAYTSRKTNNVSFNHNPNLSHA
ncbi:hypothetical protein C1645_779878 [Glomus cerebriforme]|uniref:Uncharacterized protein n=1 Tax=Glomus cerebriforme TaxID=658196 RepID=A0A397SN79_9GLOM|nr:hypothetical protein C1645_779878 [Glomus cerebriforme]